ncbi:amidohydrolase [Corallococcus sp. H22C18031201]|nr:amidohydrolase [Corallococcus sp. H22C18031201]
MRITPRYLLIALSAVLLLSTACGDDDKCKDGEQCGSAVCGNGKKEAGEQCDDGNKVNGDGCEANCTTTPGSAQCGNGVTETGEQCDDGNRVNGDGCENDCTTTPSQAHCGNGRVETGEQCDDGNQVAGDGCENDCTTTPGFAVCGNGRVETGEQCDDGNVVDGDGCEATCKFTPAGPSATVCPGAPAAPLPGDATCAVTKAGNGARLFTGVVLKDGETLMGGQVLVDAQGVIQCSACDCSAAAGAAEATQVSCPRGVISPGLINPHEHILYPGAPVAGTAERYEHRHDWRTGANGHTKLTNPSNSKADIIRWQELRQMLAGTTSIAGAGGQPGLLRNLDVSAVAQQEGLGEGYADSDTFPLGDSSGTTLTSGCSYASMPTSSGLPKTAAYLPHISEGIGLTALNEFRCLSQGSSNVLFGRTAIIHGVGLTAKEIAAMAERGTGLIWSPRSNVSLYGETAMVTAYKHQGVSIALGTDWLKSGSMNLLRELQCADYLNSTRYAHEFTDEQLWRMVTANAADLTDVFEKVGRIAPGKVADLAIYRLRVFYGRPHRAVVTANAEDVVLTMRGGKPLYGDQTLMNGLKGSDTCDAMDVCGTAKSVCLTSEIGKDLAALQASPDTANAYPLFACGGTPKDEPVCEPRRDSQGASWPNASQFGSTVYSSEARADDPDADGIPSGSDNCPTVFNPVRPMDNGVQADSDGDGVGDACDPCPLEANVTSCQLSHAPDDDDADGVPTWRDNCPFVANADQKDSDGDGKGDVCDGCPFDASSACATPDPTDVDNDGILTPTDNCPFVANVDQKDTDGDGMGDACDPCPVPNAGGIACALTVYDVKTTPRTGLASLVGAKVAVSDVIVTAVDVTATSGYWVQVANPPAGKGPENSGLFVYGLKADVAVGDRINITEGVLKDYFGLLELTNVKLTKVSSGNPPPAPVVVRTDAVRTGGPSAQALEGVVLEVRDLWTTGPENAKREFTVDENHSGDPTKAGLMVDDQAFSYPTQTVGTFYRVLRGVLTYTFSNSKLLPRGAEDMQGVLPALTAFTSGGYARVGDTVAFPQALTVTMASTYASDITVTVTSSDPSVLSVPGGQVVIPKNQTSVTVPVTAGAQAASVTLTATSGTSSLSTNLRVLGTNETPVVTGITPTTVSVAPGGTVSFTVSLDRPAPAGAVLDLTASPAADFGTFTPSTTVKNAMVATFSFTADETTTVTAGQVTASLGGGSATANVAVLLDAARLVSLTPSGAVSVNAGGTQVFTLTVTPAPAAPIQVQVAAVPPAGSAPFGALDTQAVTVDAGATTATFTFTANAAGEGSGSVTASLNGVTRSTAVTVVPPPAKLASISPALATVNTGATQVFTVSLDRKAPVGGVNVALTLTSGVGAFVPDTTTAVTIPEGSQSATVTFKAAATAGTGTLTASYDGVTKSSAITVVVPVPKGHVVISEISGAGLTVNADDFVELYNPTDVDIDISGWKLQYRTASTTSTTVNYTVLVTIPSGKTIKAHGYFLIANDGYVAGSPTVAADMSWGSTDISGSAGNVRLGDATVAVDPNMTTGVVDTVGYGTGRVVVETEAAPSPPGKGGSIERKALATSTSASMGAGGADALKGNGSDTDNNKNDFVTRAVRDPQNAASPTEQP